MSRQTVIHIHSNVYDNGPKSPSASSLNFGEIAVNYNATEPALFIKDANEAIVKFNAITKEDLQEIMTIIEEDELVTATALNELKRTKVNEPEISGTSGQVLATNGGTGRTWVSVTKPGDNISTLTNDMGYGTITAITMNGAVKGTSGNVNLGTVITSHQDISGKENISNKITVASGFTSACTNTQYFGAKVVYDVIKENERVTAAALNALNTAVSGKQDTIADLTTIRSNALSGKTAQQTISTYGNIVTHNVAEFATSGQGALAASAVQPNDNVSTLTNDAGYGTITAITMNGAVKGTTGNVNLGTVITSHQDISGKENIANKVTAITSAVTNTQYPSAKAVYNVVSEYEIVTTAALNDLELRKENIANKVTALTSGCTDTQYPSAKVVYDEFGNKVINQSASSVAIQPNVMNLWGEIASLTITLATPTDNSRTNEYMLQFSSPSSAATTFSYPATIVWGETNATTTSGSLIVPNIEAGKTYQISIVNNKGIIGKF